MNEENLDDFVEDDILSKKGKKKINSGRKGKGHEREIVKIFNDRFKSVIDVNPDEGGFSRSVGSGSRWSQKVNLSKEAKEIFSSDLSAPSSFKYSVECKCGYNDIDLCSIFEKENKQLDEFLEQVERDADRIAKKPLLIWKKNRQPKLAFIKIVEGSELTKMDITYAFYKDWIIVSLNNLLTLKDNFFFTI